MRVSSQRFKGLKPESSFSEGEKETWLKDNIYDGTDPFLWNDHDSITDHECAEVRKQVDKLCLSLFSIGLDGGITGGLAGVNKIGGGDRFTDTDLKTKYSSYTLLTIKKELENLVYVNSLNPISEDQKAQYNGLEFFCNGGTRNSVIAATRDASISSSQDLFSYVKVAMLEGLAQEFLNKKIDDELIKPCKERYPNGSDRAHYGTQFDRDIIFDNQNNGNRIVRDKLINGKYHLVIERTYHTHNVSSLKNLIADACGLDKVTKQDDMYICDSVKADVAQEFKAFIAKQLSPDKLADKLLECTSNIIIFRINALDNDVLYSRITDFLIRLNILTDDDSDVQPRMTFLYEDTYKVRDDANVILKDILIKAMRKDGILDAEVIGDPQQANAQPVVANPQGGQNIEDLDAQEQLDPTEALGLSLIQPAPAPALAPVAQPAPAPVARPAPAPVAQPARQEQAGNRELSNESVEGVANLFPVAQPARQEQAGNRELSNESVEGVANLFNESQITEVVSSDTASELKEQESESKQAAARGSGETILNMFRQAIAEEVTNAVSSVTTIITAISNATILSASSKMHDVKPLEVMKEDLVQKVENTRIKTDIKFVQEAVVNLVASLCKISRLNNDNGRSDDNNVEISQIYFIHESCKDNAYDTGTNMLLVGHVQEALETV